MVSKRLKPWYRRHSTQGRYSCSDRIDNRRKSVAGAHGITVQADATFSEVDLAGMDLLVLPGGMPGARTSMSRKS